MKTYATWNPSDKHANISLSGGDLTATLNDTTWRAVRSNIGKSSGKWYWELTGSGQTPLRGIANISAALTSFVGSDANGWGYFGNDGQVYTGGSPTAYGATYTTQTIGVALDMDAGTLVFYKDNVSQGTAATGLTGTIYAAISMTTNGETTVANFGATSLTYSPPSGFNAGLYTEEGTISPIPTLALLGVG